jgi:hypothetical protein
MARQEPIQCRGQFYYFLPPGLANLTAAPFGGKK